MAVRNRIVVPEFLTSRSAIRAGMMRPLLRGVRISIADSSHIGSTEKPRRSRLSSMTSVSSLRKAPTIRDPPVSAASTRARFVMLLEPGTGVTTCGTVASGRISSEAGYFMIRR